MIKSVFSRCRSTRLAAFVAVLCCSVATNAVEVSVQLPLKVGQFDQQIQVPYTTSNGLPANDVLRIARNDQGKIVATTSVGVARREGTQWIAQPEADTAETTWYESLRDHVSGPDMVRSVAKHDAEIAVAAENGLFTGDGRRWTMVLPQDGQIRWAPIDVRAVVYDSDGRLWFACPQGVGFRRGTDEWTLLTGSEGLPFNDFTCMAAGRTGVWFGTTNGAIRYSDGTWEFRQGRRWLLDNHVRDIAIDDNGNAWIATAKGVSCIEFRSTTLEEKARYYEAEIEKYHRRTEYGYVNPAELSTPGDKETAVAVYSDNDGFNTGLYLGAMCLAWSVTNDLQYQEYAQNSFRALAFLSEVTQGGPHPAPKGFIARNVIPTTGPDPNERYDLNYDIGRNRRDALWKIIQPRLPVDASGKWYWKCDSSSDELDGHFFGCATYFDRVCTTPEQKDEVRTVVRRIIDHILEHGFNLVDHDGKPTRWARFSPDDLNRNSAWCAERGLNSYSILTYLSIAHHITGDPKYREVYERLALDHGYGMNGMTQPRLQEGPDSPGHQPDDNMSFMNYYHLIRYETDPKLLNMFQYALRTHWLYERAERNSFTNFIYAACAVGKTRKDHWRETDLTPPSECVEGAVDTLKRYPLDLIEWPMSNAHRIDLVPMDVHGDHAAEVGHRVDGFIFPIDERQETYWDWNPWKLTSGGNGTRLRPGFHYLIAYYMGRAHGFISE
jgi:hypothetical protein